MKKALFLLMLFTLASFLFQISCEDRSVTPRKTHWDAVKEIISQYPDVFRLGFYDTELDSPFYRKITKSDADIEEGRLIEEDSLQPGLFIPYITLAWGDSLKGKFHYYFNGKLYEKPINTIALTYAYFERWGDNYDPHRGWLLKQFSGTVIKSVGTTRLLHTVDIVSDGFDTTLSESRLLNRVKNDSTLVFGKGEQVTFIIDVADTFDFFFLHVKEGSAYQKIPFTSIGGGKFSAWWITTTDPDPAKRYHHAIVDVVSQKSVTDTTEKYDSKAWGIIYRIK
jgi:hypothetical protein